jgi:endonuclease YncB( thermonuclease family)
LIDAPEKRQPFGQQSKAALSSLVFGKQVRVVTSGKDRYGRTIGTLWDGETNVNHRMIELGFAWHYRRFSSDPELSMLECEASTNSLGMWADPRPVEPWVLRVHPQPRPPFVITGW